jgi:hypothetical protein
MAAAASNYGTSVRPYNPSCVKKQGKKRTADDCQNLLFHTLAEILPAPRSAIPIAAMSFLE